MFWDYQWEKNDSSAYGGGGDSVTEGAFRISLGSPVTIEGKTAYPIEVLGKTGDLAPEWTHLALHDNILYGSTDGITFVPLFNSITGSWQGNAFFSSGGFGNQYFYAYEGTVTYSHPFISGDVLIVGEGSTDSTSYEYVEGYGYIYTGEPDMSAEKLTYYDLYLGPVGYYWYFYYSDYYTQSTSIDYIGLVATSLRGDDGYVRIEQEPNETASTDHTLLEQGRPVTGKVAYTDATSQNYYMSDYWYRYYLFAHDFYTICFPVSAQSNWVFITLDYEGTGEIDFYLLRQTEIATEFDILDSSEEDTTGTYREILGYFFEENEAGITLYLAVIADQYVTDEITYTICYE